ncbi:MAG TPA: hypothetical protein VLB51_09020 [Methylomirabilota bacterium]|nr:hypothetical protein [Methylomirabilota bacterium]
MASNLVDTFGSSIAVLGLHLDSSGIPWNFTRVNYYPFFAGTPTWLIDGMIDSWSGSPPWNAWEPDTSTRVAVPTDVTITLSGQAGSVPEDWTITAAVCIEAGGTGKSMRIYLAEVLDDYPASPVFTRNGIRQVAPTEDIVLASGACTDVTRALTFDAATMAQIDDVSIIAWAQDDLPSGPAEVFQATQMHWPFWTEGIFEDGFESGTTDEWTLAVP